MNIAFIAPGDLPIPSVYGGAIETLITQIIKKHTLDSNINITIYSNLNQEAKKESLNYKSVNIKYINNMSIYANIFNLYNKINRKLSKGKIVYKSYFLKKVTKDIKRNKYDFVIVEGNINYIKYLSKHIDDKIILHLHNDSLNKNTIDGKQIVNSCFKILAVSNYIKNQILTIDKAYDDKIHVYKNCVDIDLFNRNKYEDFVTMYKKLNNINLDEKIIIYSGRLDEPKGIKDLIIAFKKLNFENARLLIVGGKWFNDNNKNKFIIELEEMAKDLNNKIIFTGYIPNNEVCKYHAVADIAVVPSKCREAAGLVVIEALASGLPILCTDSGGIPEYISNDCSIVIPTKKDISAELKTNLEKLLNDEHLRKSLSKNSRNYAKRYSLEKYYEEFLKYMREFHKEIIDE